ncbi:hypothetical protein D3C76_1447120 [compost metagenome]
MQAQFGSAFLEAWVIDSTEQEFASLVLFKGELGDGHVGVDAQGLIRREPQRRLTGRFENHILLVLACARVGARIVMTHGAAHVEGCAPADHPDPPHQQRQVILGVADRQQIGDFDHGAITQPAGQQHVGVGQVDLFAAGVGQVR